MKSEVAFLLIPLLVAFFGSVLLWLAARSRRREPPDSHQHLRAFRHGSRPRSEPAGIVRLDSGADEEQ